MASSSFRNNYDSLPSVLEWYKIRDTFFGENYVSQEIPLALEVATSCSHPDACWLVEVCDRKDTITREDAKNVFLHRGQKDARALCFGWLCGSHDDRWDLSLLRRSAELGFAFGQALMARETRVEERFKFAQQAAAQGERDGYFWLGRCFFVGEGCEKDLDKAKESLSLASKCGYVCAMAYLGRSFDDSDLQRWLWLSRAAVEGDFWEFLDCFSQQVEKFDSGTGSAAFMFAIGRALYGNVNLKMRTIFKTNFNFRSHIIPAQKAIAFYEAQLFVCRAAVDTWTKVGIRFGVAKDIRKMISKLIWETRGEALYKI